MLVRIVRMTFRPEAVEEFLRIFDEASPHIRGFEGCEFLQLWQEAERPHAFTSYSHWTGPEALDRYRASALFRRTWAKTKPLFAARAEATSWRVLRTAQKDTSSPA